VLDAQAPDGAVAEMAVDALDNLRLQMLDLQRQRGRADAQMQGAAGAALAGIGYAFRQAGAGQMAADDIFPMFDNTGAAEAPALEDRARQSLDTGGDGTYLIAPDGHGSEGRPGRPGGQIKLACRGVIKAAII